MAYLSTIPQATDQPKDSQSEILANFGGIKTLVDINHVTFDDPDEGKHKWVTMPAQVATPPVGAFAAGEVGTYSFLNAATSKNELYVNKTNQATVTQIPATASILSITSSPAANTAGWSMLPSGILIKWGYASVAGGVQDVNYDATVAFGAVFSVVLTSTNGGGTNDHKVVVYSSATTKFQARCTLNSVLATNSAAAFYYFAVGRPV